MKRLKKTLTLLAALVVMLACTAPAVSAFEISGEYTEEGMKWLNENWGKEITLGDVAKIAYTRENYEQIIENVDPTRLEQVWSSPYYWGERYPPKDEVTPGPKIFDENDQLVNDPDGSILAGILDGRIRTLRSGLIVDADPVSYSGGYIHYGGSGYVYGHGGTIEHQVVESKLYGNGDWKKTSYKQKYGAEPYEQLYVSGIISPVSSTLYQSQTFVQSTNPTHSASTWSPALFY